MKKLNLLTILIMLTFAGVSFGQSSISGTAHDFSTDGWNTTGEICITCHTPHNADMAVGNAPLWNHEVTAANAYQLYASNTLDATVNQPGASSKLCLSCHDGTIALDSFGGATGATYITNSDLIGTDIRDDHPISFTYNTALANTDTELEDPSTNTEVAGMLFGNQMQCASCHDVHNAGFANLLVKENTASALCLTCHIK